MKAVWIGAVVISIIGFLCSGVLFLKGRAWLQQAQQLNASANAFALQTEERTCGKWNADALSQALDASADPDLVHRAIIVGDVLGPLQHAGAFVTKSSKLAKHDDETVNTVVTADDSTFESGSATVTVTLVDSGQGWRIRDFKITPTHILLR